ncbi:MAG: hypothetical protein GX614_13630 [Sandaracinaceae bacterium]|nr:hypothetical protein [Sandaracinaceae bacterium]
MHATIQPERLPRAVHELVEIFAKNDRKAWLVGGCVRDLLLGKEAKDFDFATNARPEETRSFFRRTIPTGIAHGTITVLLRGMSFEVTTLRGEKSYSDGRRPDEIEFVDDIREDLARRDFTINAIAYDLIKDELIDPFGGQLDLARGIIRTVGDPLERFREDGLRILRGARFASTLEFRLAPETEAAFEPSLDIFAKVSGERIRDEWQKALKARRPSIAFEIMARTGILRTIDAELGAYAAERRAAFAEALAAMDRLEPEFCIRLAALLRGLHADAGSSAKTAEALLRKLRSSRDEMRRVPLLIRAASTLPELERPEQWRRLARLAGHDEWENALAILRAFHPEKTKDIDAVRDKIRMDLDSGLPLTEKDLAIMGSDLIREVGLKPGPSIGRILRALFDEAFADPTLNERSVLLERAKALSKE